MIFIAKYIRELIEYDGINESVPEKIESFKEIIIDKKFKIRNNKISIGTFLKCVIRNRRISKKLLNGKWGVANNGELLEGIKCMVEGELSCRVEYMGEDGRNLIYTDRVDIPYSAMVLVNNKCLSEDELVASCIIDDIYLEKLNEREYMVSVSGSIIVES